MNKKILGAAIGVAVLLPSLGFGQSADLQSIIAALQAQVLALQAQVVSLQAELTVTKKNEETPASRPIILGRMLVRGMSGEDVRTLQEFLASQPGIYPEGLVTGYFGPLTELAAKRFQAAQGLEATGLVGTETMGEIYRISSAPVAVPPSTAPVVSPTSPVAPPAVATSSSVAAPTSTAPTVPATTTVATPVNTEPVPAPVMPVAPAAPAVSAPTPAPAPAAAPAEPATPADTTAPSVPSILVAQALSSSQIKLNWDASTDAVGVSGYKIYRNGAYLSSVAHVSYNNLYTDTALTPASSYSYTVAAYDAAGNLSAESGASSATTQALIVAPAEPSDFNLTGQSTSSLGFRWTDNSNNETSFTVERRHRPNGDPNEGSWIEAGSVAADATTYTDSSFPASGIYDYRVKACNSAGCSSPSNAIYTLLMQKTASAVTSSQMALLLEMMAQALRALQSVR